ncbi:breast carcinoma-amplified sequence 1 isoform X1 [Siniperca chuatsi]|uniref:breast carcinoma-amplified sequence 1 isoform X1 n=1 Tax=Siniperca chuatsi TaxID=119488 RepID=UPI001CE10D7B|nr:breast carcinoma-amplified sequence 1 isoform X1 [Siniperca chuatsi]
MGNEQSKDKVLTMKGNSPEKHENGTVNGLSANITSNGLEIDVNGETTVQQNGGPLSLNLAIESTEPNCVTVESDCNHADDPIISEIPETTVQEVVEEVKKSKEGKVKVFGKMFKKKTEPPADVKSVNKTETSNEDQTDVSLPATDPQPESSSSGDEAAMIIAEHREDFKYLHQKATQTDRKSEADISTQTGDDDDDDDTTTNTEGPVKEVVAMKTAATEEDSLNESASVIAEEVVEETANEEPLDNQMAGIIIEEMIIMKNNVYENMVFRAELVEVTEIDHIKNYDPEGADVNGHEKTEPEIAAEPESNPNKSIIEDEIVAEENNIEETVPLEVSSSLPKEVVDCVEAVFAAVSDTTDFANVNTSEPSVDEVITEDNGEGAGDMSAQVVLIETTEPESNAVNPEAGEAIGVPSLDKAPVTMMTETISEAVPEEPNPTPANQDMPVEELSVPLVTEILLKVESAHEEVTADDAAAAEDVPAMSKEFIIVEARSNKLITIEELPEDSLISPDEVKPESIPEVITTDENAEIGEDVIADVGPETVEEAEPSPVIVKDDTEVIPEAAIDALSQEFELCAITPQEPAVDNGIPLEEEVIVATTYVPLSGEQEASLIIPADQIETVAEEMTEEAIEALSNEFEAVPESVEEDTTVQESSIGGEVNRVASSEEPVEEKTEASEDVLAQAESAETPKQNPVISEERVEKNPSPFGEDATTATLEKILESVVEAISEKLEVTENIVEEPADEQADVPPMDATEESEPCVSVQEKLVEENIAPAEVLLEDANKETAAPAVEDQTDSNPEISEEPVEESASLLERQPKTKVLMETNEDEATEEMIHETDHSVYALAAIEENFLITTSDEPVAECVEVVLETIVEEIIEDAAAECDLVTSEEVAPEIIAEGETEGRE